MNINSNKNIEKDCLELILYFDGNSVGFLKEVLDYYCFNNDSEQVSDWAVALRNRITELEIEEGIVTKE